VYDKYGKAQEYVLNELTQTKTVFDRNGNPKCDVNYEGTEIAWYHYNDKGNLTEKVDWHNNVTSYDPAKGVMTRPKTSSATS